MKSTPEAYYNPTMGVSLADISPRYFDSTHNTNEAIASDFKVNKQAGDYVAKLRTKDEPSIAPNSAHAESFNGQTQQLGKVQVSQIVNCFLAFGIVLTEIKAPTYPCCATKKRVLKGKKKRAGDRTRRRAVTNPTSRHPCPNQCGRSFGRVQDARRHAIDTNICGGGNRRYNCEHCNKSFSRKDAVLRHQGLTGSRISCACPTLQSS
jgi:hypothetical protein